MIRDRRFQWVNKGIYVNSICFYWADYKMLLLRDFKIEIQLSKIYIFYKKFNK